MIFDRDGKVILARHSYMGGLSFPGGGVGRGEPPVQALLRELREEIGVIRSDPPVFFGIYTRRSGWATNVIVLYRLMNAEVEFRPNMEVREIVFVDPAHPPMGTSSGTARRLAEYVNQTPPTPFW
jgi:8-oxo-dGTP pyrophosphatase MutT (NUDIX family)